MATEAQVRANQQNAQHSTGPATEAGRAASSRNNTRHGFTGAFFVLRSENQAQFADLLKSLRTEHAPATITEALLVENMAQSFWLVQRAIAFQNECLIDAELSPAEQEKQLSLYLRYQTTHHRAFHSSLNTLLKLRTEKRRTEIGFESQRQKQAIVAVRESAEKRSRNCITSTSCSLKPKSITRFCKIQPSKRRSSSLRPHKTTLSQAEPVLICVRVERCHPNCAHAG